MALEHIQHVLQFLGDAGLGIWSEQDGESIYREFLKFWNKYKISNIEDPGYGEKLKRAVVEFSSMHL